MLSILAISTSGEIGLRCLHDSFAKPTVYFVAIQPRSGVQPGAESEQARLSLCYKSEARMDQFSGSKISPR